MTWSVERLVSSHHRDAFDCGKPSLNLFIQQRAGQYERKGMARTFVAVTPGDVRVLGFYSLAMSSISFERLPDDVRKKLPRHPIPALLLAQLAVDKSQQGQGLGRVLMGDAFRKCVELADTVGTNSMIVEAIDEEAIRFYCKYGFTPFVDQPDKLFLRVDEIRLAV